MRARMLACMRQFSPIARPRHSYVSAFQYQADWSRAVDLCKQHNYWGMASCTADSVIVLFDSVTQAQAKMVQNEGQGGYADSHPLHSQPWLLRNLAIDSSLRPQAFSGFLIRPMLGCAEWPVYSKTRPVIANTSRFGQQPGSQDHRKRQKDAGQWELGCTYLCHVCCLALRPTACVNDRMIEWLLPALSKPIHLHCLQVPDQKLVPDLPAHLHGL